MESSRRLTHLSSGKSYIQGSHSHGSGRYRYEERSDELWSEIALVVEQFGAPLTELLTATCGLLEV